jgi:hypothetical protein
LQIQILVSHRRRLKIEVFESEEISFKKILEWKKMELTKQTKKGKKISKTANLHLSLIGKEHACFPKFRS